MKECWVAIGAPGYLVYWKAQGIDFRVEEEKFFVWEEHLWDMGYCRRCGQKEMK
jgi:hypothetical protein